ncbi:MAG: 16S rRNA (adenine(1518)-N(6)/adenine(1519)-N(6))-dimethyltransferase RsmA [Syntrophothermus sp.]
MVRPKKHLGQHFLKDENIARKIIDCLPPETTRVVEVGAGTGVLTKYLLEDKRLEPLFFEIDRESVDYLQKEYPAITGKLIERDFLEFDLSLIPQPFTIIGNFPYNISSQILFRVIDYKDCIPMVIGMFQKEVAERIASPPGSKKYGILSVLLQAWYNIEYLFTVSENVFIPPPKVKSGVIRLTRNQTTHLGCDEKDFKALVKAGFNQRRKTLRNSLGGFQFNDVPGIKPLLEKRAEQLGISDFVFLTASLVKASG